MRFVKMVQLLLVIAVVSQVGAVVTSLSSSSGLVIQDNGGTSYDIDALLDEGKHIVLQSSNGTWAYCTFSGGGLNTIYEHFGKNSGDVVFLVFTAEANPYRVLYDQYVQNSKVAPLFPIISKDAGGLAIYNALEMSGLTNGPGFILHPDREVQSLGHIYSDPETFTGKITEALNDDCNSSGPIEYSLSVERGTGDTTLEAGTIFSITADSPDSGYLFDGWVGDVTCLDDPSQATTSGVMPDSNITITATYAEDGQTNLNQHRVAAHQIFSVSSLGNGLQFTVPSKGEYEIAVCNLYGQIIQRYERTLVYGANTIEGVAVPAGFYLITIKGDSFSGHSKLIMK